jgi:ubiquitin-conjugating enzyme E2 O
MSTHRLSQALCRPGDTVVWKTEDGSIPAIVQSVNAKARTAEIRTSERDTIERVPLLELDAYGNGGGPGATVSSFDSLGVRRSDFVFIHAEGTTNGAEKGRVPRIGEMPDWAKDNSDAASWRENMRVRGIELAQSRMSIPPREHSFIKKTERGDTSCNWLGEVTDVSIPCLGILAIDNYLYSCDSMARWRYPSWMVLWPCFLLNG